MGDTFLQDGEIVKICATCQEPRKISWFVVGEGDELSDVCCYCEPHEADPHGIDFERESVGARLARGFGMMSDD